MPLMATAITISIQFTYICSFYHFYSHISCYCYLRERVFKIDYVDSSLCTPRSNMKEWSYNSSLS